LPYADYERLVHPTPLTNWTAARRASCTI